MTTTEQLTYGPTELRVRWEPDSEPIECGDIPEAEMYAAAEQWGVYGCIVELRPPACGCCGRTDWEHGASVWSVIGDADYRAEVEADMIAEAVA